MVRLIDVTKIYENGSEACAMSLSALTTGNLYFWWGPLALGNPL